MIESVSELLQQELDALLPDIEECIRGKEFEIMATEKTVTSVAVVYAVGLWLVRALAEDGSAVRYANCTSEADGRAFARQLADEYGFAEYSFQGEFNSWGNYNRWIY
jgi:hypothetical protein